MESSKVDEVKVNHNTEKESNSDMRLRRLSLFSSGVGFFEHSGTVDGDTELVLPFDKSAVNDALKSLAINDPGSSPTISYHSENTVKRTLKGLSVDLYSPNYIAQLLKNLKGVEIEVNTPNPITGRILLVEYRAIKNHEMEEREAFLSLLTSEGVKIISIKEICGFSFTDPKISADVTRALDLIVQSRDSDIRNLTIKLPGEKLRNAALSYVIPTPIWKATYRLDLSHESPFLQGWAIIDNDSDTDWEDVELALVCGKPVSFIQNLYAPYFTSRPTLPLSIASIADAEVYESDELRGITNGKMKSYNMSAPASPRDEVGSVHSLRCADASSDEDYLISSPFAAYSIDAGHIDTTLGRSAAEQFEFKVKTPVSLARQQSAMIPLIEGSVSAEKMLIFSGCKYSSQVPKNPAIGVELANNTEMKLPAGPITVYDSGTYAGDALIEFFPEEEKRLISYGEDLSVSGYCTASTKSEISAVTVSKGVMIIKTKKTHKCIYKFRNASAEDKQMVLQHPIDYEDARLITPVKYSEKTSNLYRFKMTIPSGSLEFIVEEEQPFSTEVILSEMSDTVFLDYISNKEIPEKVRASLQHAIELKSKINNEEKKTEGLKKRLKRLFDEQERTRKNLSAAGSQTQQGQSYLSRLAAQDNDIDELNKEMSATEQAHKDAITNYEKYIQAISFK